MERRWLKKKTSCFYILIGQFFKMLREEKMKAKYLVILAVCFLMAGTLAFASEVGNNNERTGWKIDFGFDHSEREVELDEQAVVYKESYFYEYDPGNYYYTEQWQDIIKAFDGMEALDKIFLKFSYGWGDRYAFYFKGGMARMKSEMFDPYTIYRYDYWEHYYGTDYAYWSEDDEIGEPMKGKGDWGAYYGAGFKAIFYEAGDFKVGVDAQYNTYDIDSDVVFWQYSYKDDDDDYLDQHRLDKTKTDEYHLALIFSKKNPTFSPYGGIKISGYETDYEGVAHYRYYYDGVLQYSFTYPWVFTTVPQDFVGAFFGLDCELTEMFHINLEARVGDENAVTVVHSWVF